jgi:hypothetical protein
MSELSARSGWPALSYFFVVMQLRELPNLNQASSFICLLSGLQIRGFVDITRDLKKAGVNSGGASQAPEQASQSQHQFAFDGSLHVKVGCHGCFEGLIVFRILQDIHDRFGRKSMADRIPSGLLLAGLGLRAGAVERIAAIGFDLLKRGHGPLLSKNGFVSQFSSALTFDRLRLPEECAPLRPISVGVGGKGCVFSHSARALSVGSIPALLHQVASSPH